MSFNCVSKYGLVGGEVFLPYDVQALIADFWLPGIYKDKYNRVTKQLISEIAISGRVAGKRMMIELRNKFKQYDEDKLIWLIKQFAHSIYWHSSTWIDEDDVLISPHRALTKLSYQDLLAFKYYVCVIDDIYDDVYNKKLFTNSWNNPPHLNGIYSMDTHQWVRPCDSHTDIYLRRALFQVSGELDYHSL